MKLDHLISFFLLDYVNFQPFMNRLFNVKSDPFQSLAVHNFYVGEGSDSTGVPTKLLTLNSTLRLSVYNPATIFGIHVTSTPIGLLYSDIVVASGQVINLYLMMSFCFLTHNFGTNWFEKKSLDWRRPFC